MSTQAFGLLRTVCIVLFALAMTGSVSKADSVNYTFNGSNGSFSYTSDSGFIAPGDTLFLYRSDLNSCNGCAIFDILPSAALASDVPWVGDLVAFLASERAGTITGTTIRIDGGITPTV